MTGIERCIAKEKAQVAETTVPMLNVVAVSSFQVEMRREVRDLPEAAPNRAMDRKRFEKQVVERAAVLNMLSGFIRTL